MSKVPFGLKFVLLSGVALASMTLPVLAQATSGSLPAQSQGDIETVTVTGIHASVERSVDTKMNTDQIVDSVSASDIGQLPDFNAGDALKRVPGVDALLYQGEPRFIIVRGFDENYNDVLIDGFTFAATDVNIGAATSGRQVDMELLPSNLAARIDVTKTATPSMDANWVGGLTNFVTNSAYDFKDGTFAASAMGGAALQSGQNGGDKPTGQAAASYAMQFGSHNEFGLYVSATGWLRDIDVPQLEAGGTRNWYTNAGVLTTPGGGNGVAAPSQRLLFNYQDNRDRYGLQTRLDWHPATNLTAYVSAYYFHQDERSYRNELNAAVQTASTDFNETPTSGTFSNVTQDAQLGRLLFHRTMYGLYSRATLTLGNGWVADAGSSWSHAAVNNPQIWDQFAQTKLAYNYDTSNGYPIFTPVNAANANNPNLYALVYHRQELYLLNENRFDEQANIGHNADADSQGLGFKFGARASAIFRGVSFSRVSYSGAPYTLANAESGQTLCGRVCSTPIPLISPSTADSLFNQYEATETATTDFSSENGGTYRSREVVLAGYGQVQYRVGDIYLVGGLRAEGTLSGSGSTQATNGVYAPVSASKDYFNLLPSFSAVIDTSDTSKLRFGVSETVSRPTFGQSSLQGGVLVTTTSPPTLATGNPNLKARTADNFDLNHDWYIDGGQGIVSIGAFYKIIHNDIFNFGSMQTIPGVSTPVLVTEAQNTIGQVWDEGLEASFSHNLTFLPDPFDGFGISGNATLSRAHFPVTLSDGSTQTFNNLPEQPDQIYNLSLYYDKDSWHGRLAWNHLGELWDDRSPNFTPTGFYANRFQQPTNNVDVQVSYDITSQISVDMDALNITSQGMRYQYGTDHNLYQSAWKLPPEIMIGAKFHD